MPILLLADDMDVVGNTQELRVVLRLVNPLGKSRGIPGPGSPARSGWPGLPPAASTTGKTGCRAASGCPAGP